MKEKCRQFSWILATVVGSLLFALGFDLFLEPHNLNAGGVSGLAMVVVHLLKHGSVGLVTVLINLPLFLIGGWKLGRRFFIGSAIGLVVSSAGIDLFALLPVPETEPLLAVLYGGALCGLGLGMVFAAGTSTGGSDILVRLLKLRWRNVPIGQISMVVDVSVATLTGIVFGDISRALYTGLAALITSQVLDVVVYRFDYSKVALIISGRYEEIAKAIDEKLQRGATYLYGQGSYSRKDTMVVLTAVKKQQLAELKELVVEIDPDAFIIVEEAHQVLGDGFSRYTKDSL